MVEVKCSYFFVLIIIILASIRREVSNYLPHCKKTVITKRPKKNILLPIETGFINSEVDTNWLMFNTW